jgi:chaperonin GroES
MNFRPLRDRIVIELVKPAQKTASGLFIPATAQKRQEEAKVIAVGSEAKDIKVGDTILCGPYEAVPIKLGDVDALVMREKEVFAVIERAAS